MPDAYPPGFGPFLAAIIADPADDTARLVAADWLDENGDPDRAEFVRAQIALYRLHPDYATDEAVRAAFDPAAAALYRRERDLLGRYAKQWLAGLPPWPWGGHSVTFCRGFPARVHMAAGRWAADGPKVRASAPIECVSLDGGADGIAELVTDPSLFGLTELSLDCVGTGELRALAASPALDTLRSLRLTGRKTSGTVEVPALRACLGSPRLANVTSLRVWFDRAGDTLGFVVGGSPHLRKLRELSLGDAMRSDAARDLFDSPNLAGATALFLEDNPVGDIGVRALVRSKYLTGIEFLHLHSTGLTAESGRLLAGWPGLRNVRFLNLAGNRLGTAGIRALAESPYLGRLDALLFADGEPTREEREDLRRLPGFAHIRVLGLG
ncbi:MAG: hypothetical protein C0501_10865 [Isosphaera sp.]|nr:hypothetical protein [Isosphaera sp.]